MRSEFFSAFVLLLLVLDPLGNVPLVAGMLRSFEAKRRTRIVLRECLIAFVALLVFMVSGQWFMAVMHLSETSLSIAGGVILFLVALRMIFPHPDGWMTDENAEPFIVPLAVPLIAGPSAMATVMLMASRDPAHLWVWVGALAAAVGVTTLTLVAAAPLQKLLGERVVVAFERLMGLVLTALAVEMLLGGIRQFLKQL